MGLPSNQYLQISIHAPLAGSDHRAMTGSSALLISIHAPLAGSDANLVCSMVFFCNFNPRSPCGERLGMVLAKYLNEDISIHAPLAGSDVKQKNTESLRDSTYNFANLIKQVLWSTQNHY